jgi:hypothetical protein
MSKNLQHTILEALKYLQQTMLNCFLRYKCQKMLANNTSPLQKSPIGEKSPNVATLKVSETVKSFIII